ncbi:23S rRNA (adenine(2030)-N(6))-methyltransferase RlmJ [Alteromonas sediminis]|uniref:Ribosomal RNA large subunit methyltransferase J n=1 Tax=Alteromonas sediminis TaxID=2259342 RepID=A0A3N5ZC15_9ALTE|nr:23S rRNA (adenine(2030)-N(6))-methyltransferase RlmJ [Alteromonas sediminis]RPJ67328.1 23S rRNA (adenine(2030)-N(6))-methyltransferase RlmJ [Alteromonas sediminis]
MLSYQHYFHAGNHADVLKHLCWYLTIDYLNKKDKPYTLIDTHAGEGVYPANDTRNTERLTGIAKLASSDTNSALLNDYLALVSKYSDAQQFPGSPAIAHALMRTTDKLHVIERHPSAYKALQYWAKSLKTDSIHCHNRDAFEGVVGLCPPKVKRGAIIIDPPYEQVDEYTWVANAVSHIIRRWPQAHLLIWYPLLGARAAAKAKACNTMTERLIHIAQGNQLEWCNSELCYTSSANEQGMYGSGVLCLNPSWVYADTMRNTLPNVVDYLGSGATWSVTE